MCDPFFSLKLYLLVRRKAYEDMRTFNIHYVINDDEWIPGGSGVCKQTVE